MISLDQEKAFDRVEWSFLHNVLQRMNIGPVYRRWLTTLYIDISSRVIINSCVSRPFHLGRGVRQWCPLSPIPYVLWPFMKSFCICLGYSTTPTVIFHSEIGVWRSFMTVPWMLQLLQRPFLKRFLHHVSKMTKRMTKKRYFVFAQRCFCSYHSPAQAWYCGLATRTIIPTIPTILTLPVNR